MAAKAKVALIMTQEGDSATFEIQGTPTIQRLAYIEKNLLLSTKRVTAKTVVWDLSKLESMDSALALLVAKHIQQMKNSAKDVVMSPMADEVEKMLAMAQEHAHFESSFIPEKESYFHAVGVDTLDRLKKMGDFLRFFGQMSVVFFHSFFHLRHIRWKEMTFEIYESGIKALPIIALTMFLIGVVVAYQSAAQLKLYGANIFIVDMLGISILRELAPMLAAIIVAGRSGSSYAAQIGVMKITEELDAMRTMGFDPYAFLVLPRMLALVIMMPILIFFADIAGLIGGMLIAKVELGLTTTIFMERFVEVVKVKHFWIGLIKGPFFAILIATIGIYRGLQVKNDTQSIGFNTTKAVVESIFAVIICDAFFSIIFTNLGY
ncbi:MAG: MlaE family lipid ABC transporter permease subunit [Sulfurimonadaceae bacterium]